MSQNVNNNCDTDGYDGYEDIKELNHSLMLRYRAIPVRINGSQDEPFVKLTDGMETNLKVERGDGLFGWRVTGKIRGDEVEFEAKGRRKLSTELDERLHERGLLEYFLGIDDYGGETSKGDSI